MLVTTSLILKYKTFPCPPFRPHHRGALTQHHFTHISCPPRHLPNFPITQSPTPLPLTPCLRSHPFATLPINPSTHQPLPPSNHPSPHYIHIFLTLSNPSFTTHNTFPSTLIVMSHPVFPYPAFLSISTLTPSYPSTSHRLTLSLLSHDSHFFKFQTATTSHYLIAS